MPRLPRLSSREAIRALERLGFVQVRQKGSHIILQRGSTTVVVPRPRELKVGTLAGIIDQSDFSPDEFMDALK